MRARTLSTTALAITVAVLVTAPPQAKAERESSTREMLDAASQAFSEARTRFGSGTATLDEVYRWSIRWLEAARRHQPSSARAAAQSHLARMREVCNAADRMVHQGTLPPSETTACRYYLAEAQVWVTSGVGPRR